MPPAVALHVTDDTMSFTGPVIGLHRPGQRLRRDGSVHPGTGRTSTVSGGSVVGK